MRPENLDVSTELSRIMLAEIKELKTSAKPVDRKRRDRLMVELARLLRREKVSHDPEKRKALVERKIQKLKTKVKEVRKAAKKEPHMGKKARAKEAAVNASKSGPWSDLLKRVDGPGTRGLDA